MRYSVTTGFFVRLTFLSVLLAASGCASTYYTNLKPSDFTKVSNQKSYIIEQPVTSQRKAESAGDVDSMQGILPGAYHSSLENQDGTLYFGGGRSYFIKYANRSDYYLRAGGFWLPKAQGAVPKLFYVVDSSKIVTATSIEAAVSGKNTDAGAEASVGLILDMFLRSEDGHIILVPTDAGFAERLSAELKPTESQKAQ